MPPAKRILSLAARAISCLCAVGAYSPANAQDAGGNEAAFQQRFEAGAVYLLARDYPTAALVFADLYRDTSSDRVKLEWARALYLSGDYDAAALHFREVLADNPPLPVHDRVNSFLDDIALKSVKFDVSFGVATDTNPRALTSERSFDLFGYNFNYTPGFDTSPQYGASYGASASKSFGAESRIVGTVSAAGTEFAKPEFSTTTSGSSVLYYVSLEPRIYIKPGFEITLLAHDQLYNVPYAAIGGTLPNAIPNGSLVAEVKFGEIAYPAYSYLNADYYAANIAAQHYLDENVSAGIQISLARNEARESPYSFTTYGGAGFSTVEMPRLAAELQIGVGYSYRRFSGKDVFFGVRRADHRVNANLAMVAKLVHIQGFSPALEIGWEENTSNLALYRYARTQWGLSFRKQY